MAEVLISPDVESLVVAYLKAALTARGFTVAVGTKIRSPRPAGFVQVLRLGGVERDRFTDSPLIVVHSWAESDVAASALARTAQALLKAAPDAYLMGGSTIDRYIEVGGVQNNPDPDTANPRYSFSAQLDIRKSVLL